MKELDVYDFFFHPINILLTIVFLSVILIWANYKSNLIADKRESWLYRWNVYHKLFFSSVFAFYYIGIFKGGDTYAYWMTADSLQNLLFYDFGDFWEVMTSEPTRERFHGLFNYETGYPLRFIYMEEESFFVAKILLIFKIITFDSYLASTFLFSFLMANSSWRIYTIAKEIGIFKRELLIIFVLFLPSVAFWSSGISKDTIVFIAILNMIYYLYYILKNDSVKNSKIKNWFMLLMFSLLIYYIRPFILFAMLTPLVLMYVIGVINRIKSFTLLRVLIKAMLAVSVVGVSVYVLASYNLAELLASNDSFADAIVVQQDFQHNTEIYGGDEGKRYSLGEVDFTLVGIVKVIPASIVAGIYRPFIWEALTPSLLFNGLESLLLIFLTFWFLMVKPGVRIRAITTNELLVFSFGFILFIAFMAGFTSILFGVLVRIRAPLLPFLGLLLSIDWKLYLLKQQNPTTAST